MGFRTVRSLMVYHGPLRLDTPWSPRQSGPGGDRLRTRVAPPRLALHDFAAYHTVAPAWQREPATLERVRGSLDGLGLWEGSRLGAYLLFSRQSGGYAILDAGASAPEADARRDALVRLLRTLCDAAPETIFRVINTPPGDALGAALDLLACPIVVTQREMTCGL
jgi:hypothetical protein